MAVRMNQQEVSLSNLDIKSLSLEHINISLIDNYHYQKNFSIRAWMSVDW